MNLGHINSPNGYWKWFQIPGTDAEVELRLPLVPERRTVARQNAKQPEELQDDEYRAHIAREWFRDFRGMRDANGGELENTVAIRIAILQAPDLWLFVTEKLVRFEDWRERGNADSGSASHAGPPRT